LALILKKQNLKLILKSACLAVENTAKLPLLCRAEIFARRMLGKACLKKQSLRKQNVLLQFGLDSLCGCLRWRGQETS